MEFFILFLPFLCVFAIGVFDAACTIRRDAPQESIFWRHEVSKWKSLTSLVKKEDYRSAVRRGEEVLNEYDLWFIGGNRWYPPHFHFMFLLRSRRYRELRCADFYHECKNFWIAFVFFTGVSCMLVGAIFAMSV